jgi:lipopolysaccharide export LptBFGC system permease protein LptF
MAPTQRSAMLLILAAAAVSLVLSVVLYFTGDTFDDRQMGIFVGLWVPSILSLGAFLLAGMRASR